MKKGLNMSQIGNYKSLNEHIKSDRIPSLLIFFGEEEYLINWGIETLKKKYILEGFEKIDFIELDSDAKISELIIETKTFPVASEKKIISIKNSELLTSKDKVNSKDLNSLKDILKSINELDDIIVIFSNKVIDKRLSLTKNIMKLGNTYQFNCLDIKGYKDFIAKNLRNHNKKFTDEQMNLFVEESGYLNMESNYRLENCKNDIEKLVALTYEKEITNDDILWSVTGDKDIYIFNFLNDLLSNKKGECLFTINQMFKEGKVVMQILASIINQLETLLIVEEAFLKGLNVSAINKVTKIHEYRIKKMMPYLNYFNKERLIKVLKEAYKVDFDIKRGVLEEHLAMERFIAIL